MKRLFLTAAFLAVFCAGFALAGGHTDRVYEQSRAEWTPVAYPDGSRLDLIFESFEDGVPPAGWSIMTSGESNTWEQSGNWAHSGQYSALVNYGEVGVQDEWLVSPAVSTNGLAELFLEFYEQEEFWNWGMAHYVMISTTVPDDPAAFSVVLEMTPDNHNINPAVPVTVTLNDYIGYDTVYVALRYVGEFADNWWVDDFYIYEPPEHDVKALAVVPDEPVFDNRPYTPQLVVENFGVYSETFGVEMVITESGDDFYTDTVTVIDLAPGQTVTVAFSLFEPSAGNYYELTGTTMLEGDEEPNNDVATATAECVGASRIPLGFLVTNWDCGPCAPANQVLDSYIFEQYNSVALIRVHCWWPGPDDPMYLANVDQSTFLVENTPTGSDYAPHLWIDNYVDTSSPSVYVSTFEQQRLVPSPLTVAVQYEEDNSLLLVSVDVQALMPDGDYRVFAAVTEDDIFAQGTNGEPVHDQAFRWLYPDTEGVPLTNEIGIQEFEVALVLDEDWVFDNLRGTAYVQEANSGEVLNSGTMFLREGSTETAVGDETGLPRLTTRLDGAHPNPFNPMTTIRFSLASEEQVKLSVFDMAGKRVAELVNGVFAAGDHPVIWNGKDAIGRDVSSGTYLIYMEAEGMVRSSKMMLVR